MQTRFGTLTLLSSGYCHMCDSTINEPTWCFVNGGTVTEMRHLIDDGRLSKDEAADMIAQAQALQQQQTKP